jgi:hypothetical protein
MIDEETYRMAETIVSRLNELKLKVRVVCYTDLKDTPYYFHSQNQSGYHNFQGC